MRITLLLAVFVISLNSVAQIGDVEIEKEPVLVGTATRSDKGIPSLQYIMEGDQRYYMLLYHNAQYSNITDIKSVGFYATEEEIEYLYQFLKEGYHSEEDRTLKVGQDELRTQKTMGSIAIFVDHVKESDGFFYLTKKMLDRLFGKTVK